MQQSQFIKKHALFYYTRRVLVREDDKTVYKIRVRMIKSIIVVIKYVLTSYQESSSALSYETSALHFS